MGGRLVGEGCLRLSGYYWGTVTTEEFEDYVGPPEKPTSESVRTFLLKARGVPSDEGRLSDGSVCGRSVFPGKSGSVRPGTEVWWSLW